MLQVAIVCCPYYHLRAQQIFHVAEGRRVTLCNMKFVARGAGYTSDKQSLLATGRLLFYKGARKGCPFV